MSKLRHLHGTVDAEILFGFNNTGNVCVWPAEEILAYYLLKHPELCRNKRVCELGGGMTCLAGVMVSLGIEAKQVLLTDGNERSVQNLSEIVKANKTQFKSLHTSERCLQWNQWNQLGDLRESFDMVICADCLFFDDCREDLALIIRELLTSQGEALILAPQRSGTFQKFESIAKQMFENVERQTNYDADVTRIHKMLLENGNNGFDENLHYPWLLKIANKLPQSS